MVEIDSHQLFILGKAKIAFFNLATRDLTTERYERLAGQAEILQLKKRPSS